MFGKDVGKTLKILAQIAVWVSAAVGLVVGCILAWNAISGAIRDVVIIRADEVILRLLGGIVFAILLGAAGFGIGWLVSVALYAFGDLVSSANKLSRDTEYLCRVKSMEMERARLEADMRHSK